MRVEMVDGRDLGAVEGWLDEFGRRLRFDGYLGAEEDVEEWKEGMRKFDLQDFGVRYSPSLKMMVAQGLGLIGLRLLDLIIDRRWVPRRLKDAWGSRWP